MTVHKPDWMTPTDTGYRATCETCGWAKEYKTKASARGGLAGHKCRPRRSALPVLSELMGELFR